MNELNVLDFILIAFTLFGMIKGFRIGLIQSVVGLLGWFVALILGSRLAPVFAPHFVGVVDSEVLQLALGFLTVALLVLALLQVIAMVLKKLLETLKLSILDKMAGGVLGTFKNVLIILVVLNFAFPLLAKIPTWQTSVLAPELLPYAPLAKDMIEKTMGDAWQQVGGGDINDKQSGAEQNNAEQGVDEQKSIDEQSSYQQNSYQQSVKKPVQD